MQRARPGEDVVPISGTKACSYLEENAAAADGRVDDADLARAFPPGTTAGERYPAGQTKRLGL
jgi:aryl-alcohol dehydrogenase-like predicted oxidoreductase